MVNNIMMKMSGGGDAPQWLSGKEKCFDLVDEMLEAEKIADVAHTINQQFFEGGPLSPKSFSSLASISIPGALEEKGEDLVRFKEKISVSALLGYAEVIPGIGTVLAIIKAVGHLIGMISSSREFSRALDAAEGKECDSGLARQTMTAAVNYTVHYNHFVGSLLSVIPLLKPTVRLAQGIIYHVRPQTVTS